MSDNQGGRQGSAEAVTGKTLDYNGDLIALFDNAAIPAGDFNGRFLAWINQTLGATYHDLPSAQAALAANQGAALWDGLSTL